MRPDAGGTFLTRHCAAMAWFPHEPIDAVTNCILYSLVSKLGNTIQGAIAQQNGTKDAFTESRERSEMELVLEKTLDPIAESPATGKSVAGIINLCVDDLFGTSGNEIEQRVLTRLTKYYQVGPEDWNDVAFAGQRIRWTQDFHNGPYIEVSQEKAIEKLEEIPVGRNTKANLHRTPSMHTVYRSFMGQISWLQSRTQFQCCYTISRCASMAASPTVGDVKSLNKLARQIKSQPVKLQYWPLTEPLRILGFPDASYRNNEDGSSQRGMAVFLAESRERSSRDGMTYGSLIDDESQKI